MNNSFDSALSDIEFWNFSISAYSGVDWFAMLVTLIAIYLIGNHSKSGFYLMIIGNVSWIGLGLLSHSLALIIANLLFAVMNVRAIYMWSKEKNNQQTN